MQERDWSTLIHSLRQGQCILLLGPDVPTLDLDGRRASLADVLERELARELPEAAGPMAGLHRCAQSYFRRHGRMSLESLVEEFMRQHVDLDAPVYTQLASLPFPMIISSAHDWLMQRALEAQRKTPQVLVYEFGGEAIVATATPTPERPLLFHLFGHARQPGSMVITENDVLDLLVSVISKKPRLPERVHSELQKRGKSLLFVGFGLRHWYLKILLHVLQISRGETRSFALEMLADESNRGVLDEAIVFFRSLDYKIDLFDVAVPQFVDELCSRFRAATRAEPAQPIAHAGDLAGNPSVFISYVREDRVPAERLAAALEAKGVNPWLDNLRLKPGDQWDPQIEQGLWEQVDFCVVIQSRNLLNKVEGYVNKEIALALKRQERFRANCRFIIPAVIDDSQLLRELRPFQAAALRSESDYADLASFIKRSHQLRQRDTGVTV